MCGVCGHLPLPDRLPAVADLEQVNAALQHRGPDDSGLFVSNNQVAMAMRRLAIIAPGTNKQPLVSTDGRFVVVFNGEIYNYQDLSQELSLLGHTLAGLGDTEVILYGFKQWGRALFSRLIGMFAIAIWDSHLEELVLTRDHFGQKPLFWSFDREQGFVWGSELKALTAFSWIDQSLEESSIFELLQNQYISSPDSAYAQVKSLESGCLLIVKAGEVPRLERYFNASSLFVKKSQSPLEQLKIECREILTAAVRRTLIADRPLGIYLSGGLDSSIITKIASSELELKPKTFSIDLYDSGHSESSYARELAAFVGSDHHSVAFGAPEFRASFENLISTLDQPLADPALIPLSYLCSQTKNEICVALTGDGGDELLAGYTRYIADRYARLIPKSIARFSLKFLSPWLRNIDFSDYDFSKALRAIAENDGQALPSFLRWNFLTGIFQERFWSSQQKYLELRQSYLGARNLPGLSQRQLNLDASLIGDIQTYLASGLLPKSDRAGMLNSLELRSPFLDLEFANWAAKLPDSMRLRGCTTKYLLRESFREQLPDSIYRRQKQGFNLPLTTWLNGELRSWLCDGLKLARALEQIISQLEVNKLLNRPAFNKNEITFLWKLFCLNRWLIAQENSQSSLN